MINGKTLSGKTGLVTGGSSGIGLATARRLAAAGAGVHLLGRDEGKLARAVAEVGAGATPHRVDLNDDAQVRRFCADFAARGPLDVLVHSAGTVALGGVASLSVETFDQHYRLNLRAPYLLTQLLLPRLLEAQGQVVFVNSGAGLNARGDWSQYAASKHGLKALADSLRDEVKADGVRVTSVYPGRTASPMQRRVRAMEGQDYREADFIQPDDVAHLLVAALTLPRTAAATDLVVRPG